MSRVFTNWAIWHFLALCGRFSLWPGAECPPFISCLYSIKYLDLKSQTKSNLKLRSLFRRAKEFQAIILYFKINFWTIPKQNSKNDQTRNVGHLFQVICSHSTPAPWVSVWRIWLREEICWIFYDADECNFPGQACCVFIDRDKRCFCWLSE